MLKALCKGGNFNTSVQLLAHTGHITVVRPSDDEINQGCLLLLIYRANCTGKLLSAEPRNDWHHKTHRVVILSNSKSDLRGCVGSVFFHYIKRSGKSEITNVAVAEEGTYE